MKSNYKQLGRYIRPVDVRNRDLAVTRLLGVSIAKEFMPSIANTVGTDMSSYKVVRKGQFAYGPVTSRNGDKISVALLREKECIISQAYTAFEIIDTNELDPEYLMLWFSRPEFDRYARFHSHGSVREIFGWDEMCRVELPVPDIDVQRGFVRRVTAVNKIIEGKSYRIDVCLNAIQAVLTKYREQTTNITEGTLSDIADYVTTRAPRNCSYEYVSTENMLRDRGGVVFNETEIPEAGGILSTIEDTLVSNIRPYLKKIWFSGQNTVVSSDVLVFRAKRGESPFWLYSILNENAFFDYVMSGAKGTKMPRGDKQHIMIYPIRKLSESERGKFDKIVRPLFQYVSLLRQQRSELFQMKSMLISVLLSEILV